jgi:hypothetical protein
MRNRIRKQLRLVEPSINHEHANELIQIQKRVTRHPEIGERVYADLVRDLDDPEAGRDGTGWDDDCGAGLQGIARETNERFQV